jgi:hypothetical protein
MDDSLAERGDEIDAQCTGESGRVISLKWLLVVLTLSAVTKGGPAPYRSWYGCAFWRC